LEVTPITSWPREEDRGHPYIFLEEEASSCPDPLEKNVKDEI
jgi:hypothetical protein